jgi:DHA2 family multidrug resistance protein
MVLAFEQVLLLTGICFLCVLPLLLFLKVNRRGSGEKIHVEM